MQDNTFAYFVVDNLKYLVKNGRLSGALGFIGGIMKIKPIIFLGDDSGLLKIHEKVRTLKKALKREFELIEEGTNDAKEVIFLAQDSGRPDEIKKMI
jgi:fatty acid-binding protein DegV